MKIISLLISLFSIIKTKAKGVSKTKAKGLSK